MLQGKSFEHLMIPLKDILSATENFHSKYKIGVGGYGTVYKAKLEHFESRNPSTAEGEDDGGDRRKICSTVAIKRISSTIDGTGEQGFIAEVKMLSNCKHPNIVSLLGFCEDGPQKILIYEYVPNGSLDGYLEHSYRMTNLTWGCRIQICLDIAHGLNYLHSGLNGNERIIHRDIKSANILLDNNLRAKIADFGLSRLYTINSKNTTINTVNLAGTELYLDPEYMKTGKLKTASDIYSFGVVLFEILCGRLAYDKIYTTDTEKGLPSIARRLFKEGKSKAIVDPTIKETDGSIFWHNKGAVQHSLDTFINIATQCLAETQDERPTIEEVIKELEKVLNFQKNNKDNLQVLLEDINLATQNFSDCNCIGEGKFWKLYKGDAPQAISNARGCNAIVVKRWNMSGQGLVQFFRELEFVFKYKHENVIDLVGYCYEMEEKIIVYEHSSKGSLDKYLKDISLSWMERLKICIDVASGLEFLHSGAGSQETVMMHGDIKSGSILIDGNGKAKISNLELITTDTFNQQTESLCDADGNTIEFLDPSIVERGNVSKESDIYSLGVLLFEVLTGRLAKEEGESLGPLANRWCRDGELDEMVLEGIKDQIDPFSFDVFTSTAYSCFKTTSHGQPYARDVLTQLEDATKFQIYIEEIPKTALKDIKLGSDDKCIQEGRYWKLYDAQVLQDNANGWTTVFAKRWDNKSRQAHALFLTELRNLREYKNEHIVALVGYCNELNEKIIFYEHASNGSLDKHLDDPSFTWKKRLNICMDVVSGLQCLHKSVRRRPKHKAIKSGSILIDGDWKGKIANLEYYPHIWLNDLWSSCPVALGPTESVDVYALGVVLLEILCGRLARPEGCEDHSQSLGPLAQQHYKEKGNLDELVFKGIEEQIHPDSLILFQGTALKCLGNDRGWLQFDVERKLKKVESKLRKALEVEKCLEVSPQLSLEDIKQRTQNFSDDKCVGKGKYWKLYEGEFPDANADGYTTALVKRWDNKSREALNEFLAERGVLSEYENDNDIVGIEGYCNEMDEKIIVYEHGCNRSLDKHLDDASLSWTKRLSICLDVARVVNYLHRDGIGLRDIKSGSILIDSDWKGKVYNLKSGLSRGGYYPLAENDRIHELGVVLLELLCGRLDRREGCEDHSQSLGPLAKRYYKEKGNLDELVFEGIKEQIAPESLIAYQEIALKCISAVRDYCWLVGEEVVKPLRKALELQEDYERWNSKLPKEYKEYIQMSKTPEIYSTEVKKDLHDMLTKGILLQQDQLLFTLGANGERNEMISSTKFAYKNRPLRIWQSIPESRFQKVAQMLDISNLKIQIRVKTQFLTPGIDYRVYLVFKFCGSRKSLAKRVYVNLSYKRGKDNLHSYFATWRDDEWMMIELCRFSNDKKDVGFEAILKSFSRCYCASRIIYAEGIEFRAIDKYVQQVLKSSSRIDEVQRSPTEGHEIFKISGNDEDDKMFSVNKGNGKKHLTLSPIEFLCESSNVKSFDLNPSSMSRSQEVEFLPQQVFGIKCKIESRMLSPDTDYMCYLVFKFSEKCNGLHGPVIIRDLLKWKNKETGILYIRSPSPWNLHDTDWVPRERKDGWMEVTVWKFNSKSELRNDSVPMNLKLITYEGTMSGLIVCSLEIRPI